MAFNVILSRRAEIDIDEHTLFIAADSPSEAAKWKTSLESLILSLEDMPARFPVVQEAARLKYLYRSANYHSHRVIFRIDEQANTVFVVRVYHAARKPLTERDVI